MVKEQERYKKEDTNNVTNMSPLAVPNRSLETGPPKEKPVARGNLKEAKAMDPKATTSNPLFVNGQRERMGNVKKRSWVVQKRHKSWLR